MSGYNPESTATPEGIQYILSKGLSSVQKTIDAQKEAVSNLSNQFSNDDYSQKQLLKSLETLLSVKYRGGKIVMCGVGKSFKIASKLLATLNSLSIQSVTLHPTEALHGDLGLLNENDGIIMLTASGNTPELLGLLPHLSSAIPIILLTCNRQSKLALHPKVTSLLYTELPEHLKEDTIHGIPAPTVSATLSLILADSTILALSELIQSSESARKKMFSMKHPGGSIGANLSHLNDNINLASTSGTHNSSYTSFLSLELARNLMNSRHSSSSSSEIGDLETDINDSLNISLGCTPCGSTQVIDDFNNISELELLKFITIADYLVTFIEGHKYGIDSKSVKESYALYTSKGEEGWELFVTGLIPKFRPL